MAKATGPLGSQKARGKFAKALIFFTDKGRQRIKGFKKPRDKKSPAQLLIRALNFSALTVWKIMSLSERKRFRQAVWTPHFHGYHYFLHQYITRVREDKPPHFEAPMKLALNWPAGNRRLW